MTTVMKRHRHTPEQAVRKVREGERMLNEGRDIAEVVHHLGIAESTWNRWRNQYGGMKADEARQTSVDQVVGGFLVQGRQFGPASLRQPADASLRHDGANQLLVHHLAVGLGKFSPYPSPAIGALDRTWISVMTSPSHARRMAETTVVLSASGRSPMGQPQGSDRRAWFRAPQRPGSPRRRRFRAHHTAFSEQLAGSLHRRQLGLKFVDAPFCRPERCGLGRGQAGDLAPVDANLRDPAEHRLSTPVENCAVSAAGTCSVLDRRRHTVDAGSSNAATRCVGRSGPDR
jgi:hypothetical protein